ncbi:MAG: hypothetical protein WB622_03435 [Acidobacteriaceae bacterium]|jgi:hypothetical protein
MKDRVILLTSIVLAVSVALFAWFTWVRWGIVGVYPVVGRIVVGAAVFALTFAGLFSLSRGRTGRAPQRPVSTASQPVPMEMRQEAQEKSKATTVEIS